MNASGGRNCSSNKARLEELFQGIPNKDFDIIGQFPEDQCFYKFYCVQKVNSIPTGVGLGSTKKLATQAASKVTLMCFQRETLDVK